MIFEQRYLTRCSGNCRANKQLILRARIIANFQQEGKKSACTKIININHKRNFFPISWCVYLRGFSPLYTSEFLIQLPRIPLKYPIYALASTFAILRLFTYFHYFSQKIRHKSRGRTREKPNFANLKHSVYFVGAFSNNRRKIIKQKVLRICTFYFFFLLIIYTRKQGKLYDSAGIFLIRV